MTTERLAKTQVESEFGLATSAALAGDRVAATPPDDVEHRRASNELREHVITSLIAQGFSIRGRELIAPELPAKDDVRRLHTLATSKMRLAVDPWWRRNEDRWLEYIANGDELDVGAFEPELREVHRGTIDERLFYYARLHWSIPTSRGYGRRARFVVMDKANGKLVGVIGLCDPVFALRDRDAWIGWSADCRTANLSRVVDCYVLGAVPPYSHLLAGKLVAMLATSDEVVTAFTSKYLDKKTVIADREFRGRPLLMTTVSALGRSSVYNRLSLNGDRIWEPIGWTQGTGDVAFSDGLYEDLRDHAMKWCAATARHGRWGEGFRNRREVIKKALADVGLSPEWVFHGIRRQLYAARLVSNAPDILSGRESVGMPLNRSAAALAAGFRRRWFEPRAARTQAYREFQREEFRLWPPKGGN